MTDHFRDLMRRATQMTRAGRLTDATAVLLRAVRGAVNGAAPPGGAPAGALASEFAAPAGRVPTGTVLEGCVFEIDRPAATASAQDDPPVAAVPPVPPVPPVPSGNFSAGSHRHAGQTLGYKLYVPPGPLEGRRPLVVMLHGCTQDPDDFAAGTGMNQRAAEQGFFVLYPAQSAAANASRCWNWFAPEHQQRDRGEPALIAALTCAVMAAHPIDARRVYVAGLSAGGAMAAVVAAAYPEIYAAAGIHSGLACGAACDLPSALSAMKRGAHTAAAPAAQSAPVATIVFHGDQDRTVHARNGDQVIAAALGARVGAPPDVERGVSAQGQRYTRSTHHDPSGQPMAEHWLVHGGAHAWSGGRAAGTFTNPLGPDASLAMLRFFDAHPMPEPR